MAEQAKHTDIDSEPAELTPDTRKLIKTGHLSFGTTTPKKTHSYIVERVKGLGGYVASESVSQDGNQARYYLTLKVPNRSFDQLLEQITGHAGELDHLSTNVEDVTLHYFDLESRIETKKALKKRYLALLEKAETVGDMLSIEAEIGALQSDLESYQAQFKSLDHQVSMSTLEVSFVEEVEPDQLMEALEIAGGLLVAALALFLIIRFFRKQPKA